MDALTHAIEGYTTKAAWEMTDMFHLEAIKLISTYLRGAVKGTKEGREGMALGPVSYTHLDVYKRQAKDTISKDYDQTFKLLFRKVFDEEFRSAFEQAGLQYRYCLIDDAVAKVCLLYTSRCV